MEVEAEEEEEELLLEEEEEVAVEIEEWLLVPLFECFGALDDDGVEEEEGSTGELILFVLGID